MEYDYTMEVHFPNGDKDFLKGKSYINIDDKIYYNDCKSFTIIYTKKWFYKADHRKKTLLIINLNKDVDKKIKKEAYNQIFKNGAINTFLDSFVLKSASIKKIKNEDSIHNVSLSFPGSSLVQKMDIEYNSTDNMLISYYMVVSQPWQRTPKGIQSIEEKIKFDHFKKVTDKNIYNESNYFSYAKKKIELKKYKEYKLLLTK